MGSEDRIEQVLGLVRSSGGRATPARRAILQVLVAHQGHHPSAEHIASSVRRTHPDLADSTVYRFLDELERLAVVVPVTLGSGPTVYHFSEDVDHHHLACEVCARLIEIPAEVLAGVAQVARDDFGFHIGASHLTLVGRCDRCDGPTPAVASRRLHDHDHAR